MNRPGFTVENKKGISYDANHIFYTWKPSTGWFICFICSGCLEEIPVGDVKEIRFSPNEETNFCGECDGPIPERG